MAGTPVARPLARTVEPHLARTKEAWYFFALTIGLSYVVFWGPLALFQIPTISFVSKVRGPAWAIALFIAGGFVPSLIGVGLTWLRDGGRGLRRLGRRAIQFRIGWRWYLALVSVVVLPTAGQLLIIRLLGQMFNYQLFIIQLSSAIPLIVLGPLSEEFGWRGYALGRLQTKYDALTSSIIVGAGWALWHLPLFFMAGTSQHELRLPFGGFLCGLIAISILITWLYNNTGGSLWTAILFHWIFTFASQVVSSGVTRSPSFNWLEYLPYILMALIISVVWRSKMLHIPEVERRSSAGLAVLR